MKDFNSIVISGGSVKVISVIGIIKYLYDNNKLKQIKNYVGTSAGTIFCLFMILDYNVDEIVKFLLDNLYDEKICQFNIDEMFNLLSDYGITSGQNLILFIERIILYKLNKKDITFIELAKHTGKNLIICISNITKETSEFYNVDTMPNLSIVTAIRTSCSLPIIFTPVIINEDICVDGGIYLNFPISYFKDNTLRDILGINIVGTSNKNINNFFDYLNLITNTLLNKAQSINDQDKNIITIEIVDDKWISFNDFRLHFPKEKLKDYIKLGYNAIKIKFPNYIVENEKY